MGYDEDPADGNYFYWVWKVSVAAGAFGENYQYLTVDWLKKPWDPEWVPGESGEAE